jgi:hypothetical protein
VVVSARLEDTCTTGANARVTCNQRNATKAVTQNLDLAIFIIHWCLPVLRSCGDSIEDVIYVKCVGCTRSHVEVTPTRSLTRSNHNRCAQNSTRVVFSRGKAQEYHLILGTLCSVTSKQAWCKFHSWLKVWLQIPPKIAATNTAQVARNCSAHICCEHTTHDMTKVHLPARCTNNSMKHLFASKVTTKQSKMAVSDLIRMYWCNLS